MIFEVEWASASHFFSYGSEIECNKGNECVHFENILFSPGTTIIKWDSAAYYRNTKTILQLPLLKRGKKYQIIPEMKIYPKDSIFIKISFYNRSERLVGTEILDSGGATFTYSLDAYYYTIELINIGNKSLFFKRILITEYDNHYNA